jgi:hypothetical protein
MSLANLLREIENKKDSDDHMTPLQAEAMAGKLKECMETFNEPNAFKVGDIICWKSGMANRRTPYGKPLIVAEVLESPVIDSEKGTASHYYGEMLDIKVGELMENGMFVFFHYDSRRMQHFVPEQSVETGRDAA